jgi:hypothetical protein
MAQNQGRSKVKKLTVVMVFVGLTVACGDELGGILSEIEEIYDRARPLLEQQVAAAAAEVAAAEEEIATAEADLATAQAAFEAAPGSRLLTVRELLIDDAARALAEAENRERDAEKRRLRDVMSAARVGVQAARNARRAAQRRGDEAKRTRAGHERGVQTLREAYEDDTWDLLAISQFSSAMGQDVSPRSILIEARRQAERELAELEGRGDPTR